MTTETSSGAYSVSEAARALRVPEVVVTRLIAEGQFVTVAAPTGLLITADSIDEFIQKLVASTGSSSSPGAAPGRPATASSDRSDRTASGNGRSEGAAEQTDAGPRPAGAHRAPAGRRGNGEGAPYKRKDGRWEVKFYVDDPKTGRRKRASAYGKRRTDALRSMNEVLERAAHGAPLRDSSLTVGAWARKWASTTLPVLPISENYRDQQAGLAAKHLFRGTLAAIPLNRLRPTAIEAWLAELQTAPSDGTAADPVAGPRPLAPSTVRSLFILLRKVLDAAVRDGLIARNPAAQVSPPRVPRSSVVKLAPDQVARLLRELRSSRYYPTFAFIAATGVRRGEALALSWDDVDLEARTAWVHSTLSSAKGGPRESPAKTERSRRQIVFPEAVAQILRAWRAQQDAERHRAGRRWRDSGKVFTTDEGGHVEPRNLLRVLKVAAEALGLPDTVGVHTLRHSAATAMLEAGVHVKAVADALGHSSANVTLDVYGFTADKVARAAADSLVTIFGITADPEPETPPR